MLSSSAHLGPYLYGMDIAANKTSYHLVRIGMTDLGAPQFELGRLNHGMTLADVTWTPEISQAHLLYYSVYDVVENTSLFYLITHNALYQYKLTANGLNFEPPVPMVHKNGCWVREQLTLSNGLMRFFQAADEKALGQRYARVLTQRYVDKQLHDIEKKIIEADNIEDKVEREKAIKEFEEDRVDENKRLSKYYTIEPYVLTDEAERGAFKSLLYPDQNANVLRLMYVSSLDDILHAAKKSITNSPLSAAQQYMLLSKLQVNQWNSLHTTIVERNLSCREYARVLQVIVAGKEGLKADLTTHAPELVARLTEPDQTPWIQLSNEVAELSWCLGPTYIDNLSSFGGNINFSNLTMAQVRDYLANIIKGAISYLDENVVVEIKPSTLHMKVGRYNGVREPVRYELSHEEMDFVTALHNAMRNGCEPTQHPDLTFCAKLRRLVETQESDSQSVQMMHQLIAIREAEGSSYTLSIARSRTFNIKAALSEVLTKQILRCYANGPFPAEFIESLDADKFSYVAAFALGLTVSNFEDLFNYFIELIKVKLTTPAQLNRLLCAKLYDERSFFASKLMNHFLHVYSGDINVIVLLLNKRFLNASNGSQAIIDDAKPFSFSQFYTLYSVMLRYLADDRISVRSLFESDRIKDKHPDVVFPDDYQLNIDAIEMAVKLDHLICFGVKEIYSLLEIKELINDVLINLITDSPLSRLVKLYLQSFQEVKGSSPRKPYMECYEELKAREVVLERQEMSKLLLDAINRRDVATMNILVKQHGLVTAMNELADGAAVVILLKNLDINLLSEFILLFGMLYEIPAKMVDIFINEVMLGRLKDDPINLARLAEFRLNCICRYVEIESSTPVLRIRDAHFPRDITLDYSVGRFHDLHKHMNELFYCLREGVQIDYQQLKAIMLHARLHIQGGVTRFAVEDFYTLCVKDLVKINCSQEIHITEMTEQRRQLNVVITNFSYAPDIAYKLKDIFYEKLMTTVGGQKILIALSEEVTNEDQHTFRMELVRLLFFKLYGKGKTVGEMESNLRSLIPDWGYLINILEFDADETFFKSICTLEPLVVEEFFALSEHDPITALLGANLSNKTKMEVIRLMFGHNMTIILSYSQVVQLAMFFKAHPNEAGVIFKQQLLCKKINDSLFSLALECWATLPRDNNTLEYLKFETAMFYERSAIKRRSFDGYRDFMTYLIHDVFKDETTHGIGFLQAGHRASPSRICNILRTVYKDDNDRYQMAFAFMRYRNELLGTRDLKYLPLIDKITLAAEHITRYFNNIFIPSYRVDSRPNYSQFR